MGGTSTDVCRFDGKYEFLTESRIANRTINVPMLNIQTVAAGGGSILFARNSLLAIRPESAGTYPGPASYRNGGPLTVTDANLFLGRLNLSSFPAIFGKNTNEHLDVEVVRTKFQEITNDFNAQTSQNLSPEEVALGFLNIANETMSRPIRNATEHACDIARQRVIDTTLRAFRCVAAFQGCASSFGWGMGGRNPETGEIEPGWNYGESIGGGSGAGPGWHGESAVRAHSTNTRITDVEKRTPVVVRRYEINRGTGGRGRWHGGDGITREVEARIPLKASILS
ncbi:Rac GTPase-activating protein BCR/ABR [Hypoxylon texense]